MWRGGRGRPRMGQFATRGASRVIRGDPRASGPGNGADRSWRALPRAASQEPAAEGGPARRAGSASWPLAVPIGIRCAGWAAVAREDGEHDGGAAVARAPSHASSARPASSPRNVPMSSLCRHRGCVLSSSPCRIAGRQAPSAEEALGTENERPMGHSASMAGCSPSRCRSAGHPDAKRRVSPGAQDRRAAPSGRPGAPRATPQRISKT